MLSRNHPAGVLPVAELSGRSCDAFLHDVQGFSNMVHGCDPAGRSTIHVLHLPDFHETKLEQSAQHLKCGVDLVRAGSRGGFFWWVGA